MSNVYKISGVVAAVKAPYVQRNGKPHRDLVIENEIPGSPGSPPRKQPVLIGFSGHRVALLDGLQILDRVTVSFGISGRTVFSSRDGLPHHAVSLYGLAVVRDQSVGEFFPGDPAR